MKQYVDVYGDGTIYQAGDNSIPASSDNGDFVKMQAELAAGEAEITAAPVSTAAAIVTDIKAEAQHQITVVLGLPEWKQRNMIMRAVELVEKKALDEPLSEAELAEESLLKGAAAIIKNVRVVSNSLELAAASLTEQERASYNVKNEFDALL